MSTPGKEIAEAAVSAGAGILTKDLLHRLAEMDNDKVQDFLRESGFDETTVMIVAAVVGYGGKWGIRLALKLHEDPQARAKVVRVGKEALRALGRAFGPDNRVGSTGLDWTTFSEKG